jgi:hypothetical protein
MTTNRRVISIAVLAVALVAAACNDDGTSRADTTPPTTTATPPSATDTPGSTTIAVPPPNDAAPPCLAGTTAFVRDGVVTTLGEEVGDATQIAGIRWATHPGCERVVADFLTATGAPASGIGRAVVETSPSRGIVRISLPADIETTGLADALIDGELAQRVFVVRQPGENLAVEIHTGSSVPVEVRALIVDAPARLVVDLRPASEGGPLLVAPPSIGDNVVLITPTPGPNVYPLTVSGYARTFEASVVARLIVDGVVVVEQTTTAADRLDAWEAFSMAFADGPAGDVELFVGEDSTEDGTPIGVSIMLDVP